MIGVDQPWSLTQLIAKFRKLNENRLAYTKTGYLKNDRAHELQEDNKKFTFKPAVSEISAEIEKYHRAKFWEQHPEMDDDPQPEGPTSYRNPKKESSKSPDFGKTSTKPRGIQSSYNGGKKYEN